MTTMNSIKTLLLGAAIIASAPAAADAAAVIPTTGATTKGSADISVNVPDFIILHYYSSLALNFATPDTEAIDEGLNKMDVAWNGSVSSNSELSQKSLKNAVLELDGNVKTVSIPNVWAVRGFSDSGTADVSIEIPAGKEILSRDTSEIGLSNAKVTSEGKSASSLTVPLNGIARSRATLGGVEMDLNFVNTRLSGEHKGGQYTITASTI